MAPMVRNTLREWKVACPPGPLGLVFPNRRGTVASLPNLVRREFAPLQIKAGIVSGPKLDQDGKPVLDDEGNPIMLPRYGMHSLRHAAASLFIEQGFTPKKVQTLMGHSTIQMTFDVYGKLFPDPQDDQAAMAQVEARLVS